MANNGAISKTLNAGQSYTVPAGYHNGSGKVTANSLASQTQATAVAGDILTGKTAWVNGQKLTGTNKGYEAGYNDGKVDGKIKRIVVTNAAGAVKNALPDIYSKLTVENFALGDIRAYPGRDAGGDGAREGTYKISNYNAETGTVSISSSTGSQGAEVFVRSFSATIYCYYVGN